MGSNETLHSGQTVLNRQDSLLPPTLFVWKFKDPLWGRAWAISVLVSLLLVGGHPTSTHSEPPMSCTGLQRITTPVMKEMAPALFDWEMG